MWVGLSALIFRVLPLIIQNFYKASEGPREWFPAFYNRLTHLLGRDTTKTKFEPLLTLFKTY